MAWKGDVHGVERVKLWTLSGTVAILSPWRGVKTGIFL